MVTIAAELCHRVGEGAFNEHIRQHIEHIAAFVRCGYWYDVTSEMMRRNLFSSPYHYHCCCKLVHTVEEKKAVKTSIYYHTEPFKKWYILILVYYYVNYFIWGTPTPTAAAAATTAFRFHVDLFFALRSLLLYGIIRYENMKWKRARPSLEAVLHLTFISKTHVNPESYKGRTAACSIPIRFLVASRATLVYMRRWARCNFYYYYCTRLKQPIPYHWRAQHSTTTIPVPRALLREIINKNSSKLPPVVPPPSNFIESHTSQRRRVKGEVANIIY